MTGVIIAANDRDKKMWNTLPGILCQNFPVVFTPERLSSLTSEEPVIGEAKFVICDPNGARMALPEKAVIIYKDVDSAPVDFPTGQQAVAVVDSCNSKLLEQVSATKLPAITCGLSSRDTLTLSSIGEDSAVLNLQRSINCFDGTVAEPQEIPLKLTGPIDSFALMAAASVFILSGNINRLKFAKI